MEPLLEQPMSRFLWILFAAICFGMIGDALAAEKDASEEAADEQKEESDSPALTPLKSVLDEKRSSCCDLLFFRNEDVLRGTILNENFTILTPYGECTVSGDRCAGISLIDEESRFESLVTTNANTLRGLFRDRTVRFRMKSSGTTIEVRREKIEKMIFQRQPEELDYLDASKPTHLFEMSNGDLLTGSFQEKELLVETEYAEFAVLLEDVAKIELERGEKLPVAMTMKNEDVVRGILATEVFTLLLDFGATIDSVYKDRFNTIYLDDGLRQLTYKKGVGNSVYQPENQCVVNEIGMELVYVPAGTFRMGSPEHEEGRDGDEGPVHRVTISSPFYLGKYEVTQQQYQAVMSRSPSKYDGEDRPVEQVSWFYARLFCSRLSSRDSEFDYRLPTEAEWEYACRAGTQTPFYWGEVWDDEYG
jgi:hypothetical protein